MSSSTTTDSKMPCKRYPKVSQTHRNMADGSLIVRDPWHAAGALMREAQLAKALAACPSAGAARPRPGLLEEPPADSEGEQLCKGEGGLRLRTSWCCPGSLRALLRARKQGEKKALEAEPKPPVPMRKILQAAWLKEITICLSVPGSMHPNSCACKAWERG